MRYSIFRGKGPRRCLGGILCLVLLWPAVSVFAQATQPSDTVTLTREQYNTLINRLDSVENQLRAAPQNAAKPQAGPSSAEVDQAIDDINKDVRTNRDMLRGLRPGSTAFTIVGDGDVTYTWQRNSGSTFSTGIGPILLWQITPKFLVETALDISVASDPVTGDASTSVELTFADISYLVNDNLYVGGGLFTEPFGRYHRHFDPSWINPLPDDPLVFGDRSIVPERGLGIFAGGAIPISTDSKIVYDAYITNGPQVTNTGTLNWDNFTDNNSAKGYGGRIGYLPIPQLEFGYAIQYGRGNLPGASSVDVLAQAVDAQYKQEIAPLMGVLEIRGEWVFVHTDKGSFPDSGLTFPFDNNGSGGYVLVSYRPTKADSKILRDLEFVARYDIINVPDRLGGKEDRWAFGIDYWITPSIVLKAAYEVDNPDIGPRHDGFFIQCGFGL